ncbi:MAG: MBL fold metallo-hydrolase [Actinomycetota bacterium]
MQVHLCGVRGSTPAPGPDFVRYGGNTSCVAFALDGDADPTLVLDAGTGLQRLSRLLDGRPFTGTILLGHLHWDHTHGLPFFPAGDRADSAVRLLVPAQGGDARAEDVLARAFGPPHFPIRPSQLEGSWTFGHLEPGEHAVGGFSVLALDIPHGGGRTFGFRVSDGAASVAYLSDHSPIAVGAGPDGLGEYHETALRLARDVDVLIHDAQITAAEFAARARYGHSAVEYATGLAEAAGARSLVLFHHDPSRSDDEVDAIVAGLGGGPVPVTAGAEGTVLSVPSPP